MQDKKQIIGLILSVVLSVGLVVVGVNAATTIGTDVSVAGDLAVVSTTTISEGLTVTNNIVASDDLTVTATTTLNGDVVLGNAADLAVGTGTSTFAGDVTVSRNLLASDDLDVTGTTTLAKGLSVAHNIVASDDVAITGYTTTTGGLSVGGGQVISKHLTGTASLTFGVITANTCATASMTVTGAAAGDTVTIGVPYAFAIKQDAVSWSGYATTDVAVVKICNPTTASTASFAAGTFRADVWQH